jgi:hypothetical protein
VAAWEVGTIGFYAPHVIVHDVLGLVSPEVVSRLAHQEIVESVADWNPDYLFISDKMVITSALLFPEYFVRMNAKWISVSNPGWLDRWNHWYEDHYEVAASWPMGERWWDHKPAHYFLARRRAVPVIRSRT